MTTYPADQTPAATAIVEESDRVYCGALNDYVAGPARGFLNGPRAARRYAVLPGPMKLLVMYARNDSFSQIDTNPKPVAFEAVAGHTYSFESDVPFKIGFTTLADDAWAVRVIDKSDGAIVGRSEGKTAATTIAK